MIGMILYRILREGKKGGVHFRMRLGVLGVSARSATLVFVFCLFFLSSSFFLCVLMFLDTGTFGFTCAFFSFFFQL